MTSATATHERTAEGLTTGSVVSLDGVTRADVARVGHKAANLGELRQAGLPVPDGVIVTTGALASVLAAFDDPAQPDTEALKQVPLPEPLARELFEAVARFGDEPLAVRSSSVVKGRVRKDLIQAESDDETTEIQREVLRISVVSLDLDTGTLEVLDQGGAAAARSVA